MFLMEPSVQTNVRSAIQLFLRRFSSSSLQVLYKFSTSFLQVFYKLLDRNLGKLNFLANIQSLNLAVNLVLNFEKLKMIKLWLLSFKLFDV